MIKINNNLVEDLYFIDYQLGYITAEFEYNGLKMRIDFSNLGYIIFYIYNEDGSTQYLEAQTLDYICGNCKSYEAKGIFTASDYTIEIDGIFEANETAILPIEPEPEPINQTTN